MDTPSAPRGLTALQAWELFVPPRFKGDPRAHPELMEYAISAALEHVSEEVKHGRISTSITNWMCDHGMTRPAAQQVATECAERARSPEQLAPLLSACDQVWTDCGAAGDHATRVRVLKLKAQLQGQLAPKQTETRITVSVADELARRAKARVARKQADAKVIEPSRFPAVPHNPGPEAVSGNGLA